MSKSTKRISKLLSLVLRHKPEHLGLQLDENGWVEVEELLAAICESGLSVDRSMLDDVVRDNDKQRFAFSADGSRIRASQGHSVSVDVELKQQQPPAVLFHGTVEKFVGLIRESGLKKMQRQHVHLSVDVATASQVGSRRGKPIILEIDASKMSADGHQFFLSANGVWLTDHVSSEYITFPDC
ncbi:RNA 2'-phosphotransferase [Mariniblastus fucicola]|nr:RNA 2'-phosphotransferase [Mariniblastus fucicola]